MIGLKPYKYICPLYCDDGIKDVFLIMFVWSSFNTAVVNNERDTAYPSGAS